MYKIRIAAWYTAGYILLVFSYPLVLCVKFLNYRDKIRLKEAMTNIIMRRISKLMFYMTGSRIEMIGLENIPKEGPVLFVSNHQGHMDSVIIQGFIKKPKGFISITEFEKAPILRTWMKIYGLRIHRQKQHTPAVHVHRKRHRHT